MPSVDEASVEERAREIVDEFSLFGDWMARYEYLIEMGDSIPPIDEDDKTDDNYIHGCQSDVWIAHEYDDTEDVLRFAGDSNAKITKGLAALVIRVIDGQPPESIADADFDFLHEIGLQDNLSSQRQNGLQAMIKQIRRRAEAASND